MYGKSLQDNFIDKNEYGSLCNVFIKYVVDTKIDSFL